MVPDDVEDAWGAFANELDAALISDWETPVLHEDFETRRQDAAAKAVSIRERQDITPWLIGLLMPLWLILFFRRQPD